MNKQSSNAMETQSSESIIENKYIQLEKELIKQKQINEDYENQFKKLNEEIHFFVDKIDKLNEIIKQKNHKIHQLEIENENYKKQYRLINPEKLNQLLLHLVNQQNENEFQQFQEEIIQRGNQLSLEIIQKIPKHIITKTDKICDDLCPICQGSYELGQKYRKLKCKHIYHSKCIKNWLLSHTTCPLCKQQVYF